MMNKTRTMLILVILVIASAIVGFVISGISLPPPGSPLPRPPDDRIMSEFLVLKTVISSINITLTMALLGMYITIYREVRSSFTLGLMMMILVLFLYAVTSNPIVQIIFGYHAQGLGPFAMIPDLFATVALFVLAYLTTE